MTALVAVPAVAFAAGAAAQRPPVPKVHVVPAPKIHVVPAPKLRPGPVPRLHLFRMPPLPTTQHGMRCSFRWFSDGGRPSLVKTCFLGTP